MVERCRIRVEGPLAPYSAGFWAGLLSKGYTRLSAEKQMCLMAHLSRWLEGDALEASELTGQLAEEFLQARRAEGYATYTSPKSLGAVLCYLRAFGAAPEPVVLVDRPSVDALVNGYVRYLADDRGLAPGTIAYYADRARVFLSSRPEPLVADLRRLTASEVTAYVMDGCAAGQRRLGQEVDLVAAVAAAVLVHEGVGGGRAGAGGPDGGRMAAVTSAWDRAGLGRPAPR